MPALMKLLGHRTANMTLRYVQITQQDLQREFHLAQEHPRYLLPLPGAAAVADPTATDGLAVLERISAAVRIMDLFRQQNGAAADQQIRLLLRRLIRVRLLFEKAAKISSEEK